MVIGELIFACFFLATIIARTDQKKNSKEEGFVFHLAIILKLISCYHSFLSYSFATIIVYSFY
jgi:hypothetical protein